MRALDRADCDIYYLREGATTIAFPLRAYAWLRRRTMIQAISTNRAVYPRRVSKIGLIPYLSQRLAWMTAQVIVAQTQFQADMLCRNFGIRQAKIVVIRNGTQFRNYTPIELTTESPVVWLATLHRYKGIESVFQLAAQLPHVRFAVVGGPSRLEPDYYHEMKAKASMFPNLQWYGYVPNEQIDGVLGGALALINTTQVTDDLPNLEGFPNVYLEAWRNGVPTLTLNNDPDGVIVENEIGFCSKSVEQMARDIKQLVNDSVMRRNMGDRARRYLEQWHDIRRVSGEYMKLFHRL